MDLLMLKTLKRSAKLLIRHYTDVKSGHRAKFCRPDENGKTFYHSLSYQQDIKPSETFANKVYNLKQAGECINQYTINSGEIFSFWDIIGNPKRHFKSSRSIIKGKTVNEIGGGICQVSGLIYLTAIKARLDILERHNHSLDLYTEETRFAPLGGDATVVYGYKDLRIRNPFDFPIKFFLTTEDNDTKLTVRLLSEQIITEHTLLFDKQDYQEYCEVRVTYEDGTLINHSRYGYPQKD